MSDILDEDLHGELPKQRSVYGRWSNIPAAIVILGALFRIMHWPGADIMLLVGLSSHLGVELGYAFAFKFRHKQNRIRLVIACVFFGIFGSWFYRHSGLEVWSALFVVMAVCSAIVFVLVQRKLKSSINA